MSTQERLPLDFTQIPIKAGVALLQRLALRLLDLLLAEKSERANLAHWLSDEDLRLLSDPSTAQLRRNGHVQLPEHDRWGVLRLRLATLWQVLHGRSVHYDYSRSLRDGAQGRAKPWMVRVQVQIESERRLGGVSIMSIPRDWWSLVGEHAWRAPDFQHSVSHSVHEYLHRCMIFQRGELPAPIFAPQSFWLLTALALAGQRQGWRSWLRSARRYAKGVRVLQEIAQAEVGRPQWAGIWDQWLVVEATQRWPGCTRSLPPTLDGALGSIPIFKMLPPQFQLARRHDEAAGIHLATPNWQKDLPGWLTAYYQNVAADDLNVP